MIDLKTTTQDNSRLRTNVLTSEEGFNQAGFQDNIPQELLKYLKQQVPSGTQREYSAKPPKHSIVERILVFKR